MLKFQIENDWPIFERIGLGRSVLGPVGGRRGRRSQLHLEVGAHRGPQHHFKLDSSAKVNKVEFV